MNCPHHAFPFHTRCQTRFRLSISVFCLLSSDFSMHRLAPGHGDIHIATLIFFFPQSLSPLVPQSLCPLWDLCGYHFFVAKIYFGQE